MKKLFLYFIPAIIVLAGIFYYLADPEKSIIMPKCIMKQLTGWQCPSCGGQRALHALLHGHFAEAIAYNFFFIIAIPILLITAYAVIMIKRPNPSHTTVRIYDFVTNRSTLLSYVFLFFVWWIVRNIIGC